ncbi:MAG: DUF479 domain-containing protein [Limnothrix sp. RL_2_0]|nr:DUF479 domain-containing protein [Limnothrix sp. RL_2_0]
MNLLAHLHVGDRLSPVASAANLVADICREAGSPEYTKGINVHKKIDAFTDSHPIVLEARRLFPGELRRFSSVILDLVFDYCLSQSWDQWDSTTTRGDFIESRLNDMQQCTDQIPLQASQTIHRIQQGRLLHQYSELRGVEMSMRHIVRRRPKFAPMLNAMDILGSRQPLIDETFQRFYPELLEYVQQNALPAQDYR